ncbi:MAG TPA: SprT family zinc-dependent metalloprotease [Thermoleophilaceae bacterium]|nr:SprT family zinc-dependent metalloprotease [Thermoleophilaceae bacterium]
MTTSPYREAAIPYAIQRSSRARYARIEVDAAGVRVIVPERMPLREVAPFVARKQRWIERTLRRYRLAEAESPRVELTDGGAVPYLGAELALRVRVEPGRVRSHVARRGDQLRVAVGEPGEDAVREALERWYRRQARTEIAPRLDEAAARAGTSYTGLSIRNQRTRWASCSSRGAMSFNWRLLLGPPEILDYVVEHEVAHLEVLGHSRRFWALVARRSPDYKRHERWLRRYGSTLRL